MREKSFESCDKFSFDMIISEGGLPHASSDRLHALVYILPLYSTYRGLLEPPFAAEQYVCPPYRRVITLNHVPPRRGRDGDRERVRADARAIEKRSRAPIIPRTFHFKRIIRCHARRHVWSCPKCRNRLHNLLHVKIRSISNLKWNNENSSILRNYC